MKIFRSRNAVFASAAAFAMVATPAFADRGWGGGRGYHRDNDDTGAWVIGGIIGIGMIAAIASAASKGKRDREAREGDYQDGGHQGQNYRRDAYRSDSSRYGNQSDDYRGAYLGADRGIDGAVDRCVGEVERGSTRVDTVDSVNRDANGWRVAGRIGGGQSFDCSVDGEGRIRSVTVDGRAAS